MTTTLTITGPNFVNTLQPPLPTISNLRTLAFFGSGGDGNNANRVNGGPALIVAAGTPVYAANYVNLGVQPGTVYTALDTQNPRDATTLASGVTWAAACRVSQIPVNNAGRGSVFSDYKVGGPGNALSWAVAVNGQKQIQLIPGAVIRASIICLSDPIANYHFVAMTYTGGAAGTFTLYDYTENATTGVPVTYVASGQVTGVQTPHFGQVAVTENLTTTPIEHAFGLVANSVMSQASLAQLYAWVKANLARRSITI